MPLQTQRKAFSMLTAIFIIVIMASIGALVMSLSGKMVKETTTQFQREQAMLLAKSYTEYAIMATMANTGNTNDTMVQDIQADNVIRNETDGGFDVRVNIAFIGNGNGRINSAWSTRRLNNTNTPNRYPLNIIIDVYVKYKDLDGGNTNWITYHKRTLQKI